MCVKILMVAKSCTTGFSWFFNPLKHKNGMLTIYQLVNFAGPSTDLSHGDRARLEGSTPRRQSLWPDSSLA